MTPGISLDRRAPVCNAAVEGFLQQRSFEAHRRNVSNSRTKIKNTWTGREEERIQASRRNLKKEQLQDERYSGIEKENMRMLVRMQEIETRGPAKAAAILSLGGTGSRSASSLPPPGAGSKSNARMREAKRIDFENQRMLKRLHATRPAVAVKKTEEDHARRQRIMRMRMENPNGERLAEVRSANRSLLPPRLPTPDPTHDEECDRLLQLRNQMLIRAGLDIPNDDDTLSENGSQAELRRSRSCGDVFCGGAVGSRLGTPRLDGEAGESAAGEPTSARAAPPARARSPLSTFAAGIIPESSKAITDALMAEHNRQADAAEDAEEAAEEAKQAAAQALRAAEAIDCSSLDVAQAPAKDEFDFLSYGNIIQRGKVALGNFDA